MENLCNNSSEPLLQNLEPQVDHSAKNPTGPSQAEKSSTKRYEGLEEPDDDLRTANKRLKSRTGTDEQRVELCIEGHSSIPISKQTLRDASPYFAALLKYNEDQIRMTPPANVHLDCYVAVLHSVSNNQPPAVDESNMWDFLVLARYFLLKPLEDTCCRVIRQALPTLTMDECCRLWRNARAEQCEDEVKWFLAGIVRNLDQASLSVEFLNLGFEELIALLSDGEFLPLFEEDVYKTIIGWCEHIPAQRMTRDILDVLLAEIVWDHYDTAMTRELASSCPPLLQSALEDIATRATDRKKPKRAVEHHLIFGHEAFVQRRQGNRRTREYLHFDCLRGTLRMWQAPAARTLCTKGAWEYLTHDLKVGCPTVIFRKKSDWITSVYGGPVAAVVVVNLVDGGARVIGNGLSGGHFMEMVMGRYHVVLEWCFEQFTGFLGFTFSKWKWEQKAAPFHCEDLKGVASCLLQLPEGERIAHLLSFFRPFKRTPESVIGFQDKHKDFFLDFELLPALLEPRLGAAVIQCGTFLFVTGGSDMTDDNQELAKRCYRLDLTARDRWKRIGDLSVPRVNHCMFVKCGRVFVYGGSTLETDKRKVALMSFETYDPYADSWTAFNIPLTGGSQRELGSGCIGDTDQTTYCVDLGDTLDETKYRDVDDPIY